MLERAANAKVHAAHITPIVSRQNGAALSSNDGVRGRRCDADSASAVPILLVNRS
ncbi:hypothetical protein [Nitrosomonas sp.]|uniref:hypothetical protein n=1 Tax=Nitrosomonas sp. TaxID=42353 RepID=UPI0032EC5F0A